MTALPMSNEAYERLGINYTGPGDYGGGIGGLGGFGGYYDDYYGGYGGGDFYNDYYGGGYGGEYDYPERGQEGTPVPDDGSQDPYMSSSQTTTTTRDPALQQLLFGLDGQGGFIPGAMQAAQ